MKKPYCTEVYVRAHVHSPCLRVMSVPSVRCHVMTVCCDNDEAFTERLRNHGSAARQESKGRDIRRQPSACRADVIATLTYPCCLASFVFHSA